MTKWIVLALVCGLATPAFADATADAKAHEEAFAKACAAGDVPAVLTLYANDAIAVWPGQGEEAKGKAGIEKLATNLCKNTKNGKLVLKSIEARPLGANHIGTLGHWEQSFTGPDGKSVTAEVRTTEVLEKRGGKWLYVIDHASIGQPPPAAAPDHAASAPPR